MSLEAEVNVEKKARADFEGGKFIELTEVESGFFAISAENFSGEHDELHFMEPEMGSSAPDMEILDADNGLYTVYGRTSHFRVGEVEVNVEKPTDMWVKAPSLERALEVLKGASPTASDSHDL